MIGIFLLFFTSFLFLADMITRLKIRTKYIIALSISIFSALPIFYALWDYYSLVHLFYSLFGGVSIFCVLLLMRFVVSCIWRDFGVIITSFLQQFMPKFYITPQMRQNQCVFIVIFIVSAVLFLGHLDLIALDIFSASRAIIAIFVAIFIITLYCVDRIAGFLAIFAVIVSLIFMRDSMQSILFALFDGYLLIYSFIISIVCVIKILISRK